MSATETKARPAASPAPESQTASVRADPALTHREILEILAGLLAALFTAVLSSTIVSNALPTIIADLEGSQTQYTWVITASLLAMTVSTPVWGKLSDLMSKKLLVQLAITLFVIGSALAGMAHNVPFLIGGACPARPGDGRPDGVGPGDHRGGDPASRSRPVLRVHGRRHGRRHRVGPVDRRRDRRHLVARLALVLLHLRPAGRDQPDRSSAVPASAGHQAPSEDRLPRRDPDRRCIQPAPDLGLLRR